MAGFRVFVQVFSLVQRRVDEANWCCTDHTLSTVIADQALTMIAHTTTTLQPVTAGTKGQPTQRHAAPGFT